LYSLALKQLVANASTDDLDEDSRLDLFRKLLIFAPRLKTVTIDMLGDEHLLAKLHPNYFDRFAPAVYEQIAMPVHMENISKVISLWTCEVFHQNLLVTSTIGRLSSERRTHSFYEHAMNSDSSSYSAADLCLLIPYAEPYFTNPEILRRCGRLLSNVLSVTPNASCSEDVRSLCLLLLPRPALRTLPDIQSKMGRIFTSHLSITLHCYEQAPDPFREFLAEAKLFSSLASMLLNNQVHQTPIVARLVAGKFSADGSAYPRVSVSGVYDVLFIFFVAQ
jgi:hypothetical protein